MGLYGPIVQVRGFMALHGQKEIYEFTWNQKIIYSTIIIEECMPRYYVQYITWNLKFT